MKSIKTLSLIVLSVILIFFSDYAYASGDAGFIIKYESFSLEIRFNIIGTDGEINNLNEFLIKPDLLFYECLNWVYSNREILKSKKENISVYFVPSNKQFNLRENSGETQTVTYTLSNVTEILLSTIVKKVNIDMKGNKLSGDIPLYYIYSKDYIDRQSVYSDIFWGSLPSYMFNDKENSYFLMYWSLNDMQKLFGENKNREFIIKLITLSKKNVYDFFQNM